MTLRSPSGLGPGGRALWKQTTEQHELTAQQSVQLHEACRAKDRLDKLDDILRGDVETWARLVHDLRTEDYELRVDDALQKANTTANTLKQLLAAMRLPDQLTGARPQLRAARGAYDKPPKKVSSLDRARAARAQ